MVSEFDWEELTAQPVELYRYHIFDENHPLEGNDLIKNRLICPKIWRQYDMTMPVPKSPQKLVKRYPYKRITKEQWSRIRFYYRMGYGVRMIGRCYGYHESNIITRAKKEGWVFGELDRLINKKVRILFNLKIDMERFLKLEFENTEHWYIFLKHVNAEGLVRAGLNPKSINNLDDNFTSPILLYSVGNEVKIYPYNNGGNMPQKFIPTASDIKRAEKCIANREKNYNNR